MYAALNATAEELKFSPAQSVFLQPEFLPVDQAFVLSVAISENNLLLRWEIEQGYYIYKDFLSMAGSGETSVNMIDIPEGILKKDEYFGEVEIFIKELVVKANAESGGDLLLFDVIYRGCAEAGLCYPPQTRRFRIGSKETGIFFPSDADTN